MTKEEDFCCRGCADCDPRMQTYGAFLGGDPRHFIPDEECSTEAERELHRQHCVAWERGERPIVKISGIEWTETTVGTGLDGKLKTIPEGYKLVERAAYGLGVNLLTNNKDGSYCSASGETPVAALKKQGPGEPFDPPGP